MSVWLKSGKAIEERTEAGRQVGSSRVAAVRAGSAAGKDAVEGGTNSVAIRSGASNTPVNRGYPTIVETELAAKNWCDHDFRSRVLTQIKRGRLDRVEDIFGPVVFLVSEAGPMDGAALLVGGGWTAE